MVASATGAQHTLVADDMLAIVEIGINRLACRAIWFSMQKGPALDAKRGRAASFSLSPFLSLGVSPPILEEGVSDSY